MTSSIGRAGLLLVTSLVSCWLCGCARGPSASAPSDAPVKVARTVPPVDAAFPMTLEDDLGVEVTVQAAPQRIVSMSPPITEILFALGLGDRVVGVTSFCDYPPEAQAKDKIGGIIDPSEEKVVALEPDLIFATVGNPKPVLESFARNGLTVFSVNPDRFDEVSSTLRSVARICGVSQAGERLAGDMESAASEIRDKVAGLDESSKPRALFVVWLDPLHVAGPKTYLDDMLTLCGARNVAAETENPWKQYSVEMAVSANPDVLVIGAHQSVAPEDQKTYIAELRANPQWSTVKAVKSGRIGFIHSDLVSRTGPRLTRGLSQLAAILHPDLFPSTQSQATAHDRP